MINDDISEPLYDQAVAIVRREGKCATSLVQRRLALGYNAAARLVEAMENRGVVTKPNCAGKREVIGNVNLVTADAAIGNENDSSGMIAHDTVTADELRQFIEQYEQMEAEKKDVTERQKEIMAEAKARGYDTKVMKKVIALRKRDRDDIAEEEAIIALYCHALGMA